MLDESIDYEPDQIILSHDPDGCYVCTVEQAVELMKEKARKDCQSYLNDYDALLDYMAVHWCEPLGKTKSWIVRVLLNL